MPYTNPQLFNSDSNNSPNINNTSMRPNNGSSLGLFPIQSPILLGPQSQSLFQVSPQTHILPTQHSHCSLQQSQLQLRPTFSQMEIPILNSQVNYETHSIDHNNNTEDYQRQIETLTG